MKWYIRDHSNITEDIDATYMETNKQSGTINYQVENSRSALLMHIGEEQMAGTSLFEMGMRIHGGSAK